LLPILRVWRERQLVEEGTGPVKSFSWVVGGGGGHGSCSKRQLAEEGTGPVKSFSSGVGGRAAWLL
jgi:hypothetical protein